MIPSLRNNLVNKRISGFCCLLCLLVPVLVAGQDIPGDNQGLEVLRKLRLTQPQLNEAFDLLAVRDWDGAGRQFNRCLDALPENPNACFGMAYIANETGDITKALLWMEKAEQASLYLNQVWENQKTGLFKLSQEEKDRLLELSLGLQYKGEHTSVCRSQEYFRESDKAAQKAQDISAKGSTDDSPFAVPAEYFSLHGNLLFKMKRFEEAEAKYLEALALAPGHERCLNNLINIYFISGKIEQARSWLEKALQRKVRINPGLVQAVRQAKLEDKPRDSGNGA
jgi:tetratricopeptide (TPR) repeat protein